MTLEEHEVMLMAIAMCESVISDEQVKPRKKTIAELSDEVMMEQLLSHNPFSHFARLARNEVIPAFPESRAAKYLKQQSEENSLFMFKSPFE